MISRCPRFEEMECKGTGFAITSNHQVKVRVTNNKEKKQENHVIDPKPIIVKNRKFD